MSDTAVETSAQLDRLDGCVSSKTNKEDGDDSKLENGIESTNGCHKQTDQINSNGDHQPNGGASVDEHSEPELFFTPKVSLPLVDVQTFEDDEDVVVELRARIYRYDINDEDESEFKERGTGVVKILCHKKTNLHRILMRRDKTLKICANHYITSSMELAKHNNSDKVFVYSTLADLYDLETSPETFAIRFSSVENAIIFKNAFDDAVKEFKQNEKKLRKAHEEELNSEENDLTSNLEKITLEQTDSENKEKGDEIQENPDTTLTNNENEK